MENSLEVSNKWEPLNKTSYNGLAALIYIMPTCHIVFKDEKLLKKFNLYGAQKKGWLPPSYGKKTYEEMETEEKAVVDEFEGKAEYEKTLQNKDFYLVDENQFLIGMNEAV